MHTYTATSSGMKSFSYCFVGTMISLLAVSYSFYAPWALIYLDMNEASFMVKVPVLLWQGCFYEYKHSCIISSLVDTTSYPALTFDPSSLTLFSNVMLVVCFLHLLGLCISVAACGLHLLDIYKIRMMHSSGRFMYPTAVACFLLSLLIFFPTLAFYMQGGFFLSGYVCVCCMACVILKCECIRMWNMLEKYFNVIFFVQYAFRSLILMCSALFGICNSTMYLSDYYLSNVYTFLP